MKTGPHTLRFRLFVLILTPLLIVSLFLGYWRFSVAQDTANELFDRGLLSTALAISRDVASSEGDALSPSTRNLLTDASGGEVFYHATGPGGYYVTGETELKKRQNPDFMYINQKTKHTKESLDLQGPVLKDSDFMYNKIITEGQTLNSDTPIILNSRDAK